MRLATSPDLAENLRNGSVIPLRCIITDHGGPGLSSHFNLYYLHWWTLTYFVFESPQHRDRALALVQRGGGLDAFEQLIGPVDTVQAEWHAYVRRLKAALAGSDLEFFKSGGATGPPTLRPNSKAGWPDIRTTQALRQAAHPGQAVWEPKGQSFRRRA